MPATLQAHLYDFPKYYDVIFAADWKAELDLLVGCFQKHARRKVRRVFEPACGTGRLLIKLAQRGYGVSGNDLNPKAIDFCNARLARHGFPRTALVGDMADFTVRRKFDAAFNTINSFRHLPTEQAAESHFRCMASALARGGLYLLGLHLTPTARQAITDETWSARRGRLSVKSHLWTRKLNLAARDEHLAMTFDIRTPSRSFRIVDEMHYRTYTARQIRALLKRVPEFEIVETYDFDYDLDEPMTIDASTEDVVFVLRKR
jgi:SAM-dependent methyltransferase